MKNRLQRFLFCSVLLLSVTSSAFAKAKAPQGPQGPKASRMYNRDTG